MPVLRRETSLGLLPLCQWAPVRMGCWEVRLRKPPGLALWHHRQVGSLRRLPSAVGGEPHLRVGLCEPVRPWSWAEKWRGVPGLGHGGVPEKFPDSRMRLGDEEGSPCLLVQPAARRGNVCNRRLPPSSDQSFARAGGRPPPSDSEGPRAGAGGGHGPTSTGVPPGLEWHSSSIRADPPREGGRVFSTV